MQDLGMRHMSAKLVPTWPWVSGNSWPSTASPWFPTHLTHQIWPPVTSSSSPGWRAPWRGNDFKMSQRYN
jgi:hypothetical protein